jgi:fructose-bisphosphate aldolase class 1
VLESLGLMQLQNFEALIYEEEQRLNRSKREKIVPRYILTSPPYYWKDYEDEDFEQKIHNFEPPFRYVVEQEAIIHGIKMSKGVKPIFVTRQETIVLPRA